MELRVLVARTHRAGEVRLARRAHETPGLRQPGIHPPLMTRLLTTALAALALCACKVEPPSLRAEIPVRLAPFTPDSGTIAIFCRWLIDGVEAAPFENALVLIRDGRIVRVTTGATRAQAGDTLVPVLELPDSTCLPGLIDMHTHLTDRPEDTADLRVYFSRTPEETLA